jgi:hypothetical protein
MKLLSNRNRSRTKKLQNTNNINKYENSPKTIEYGKLMEKYNKIATIDSLSFDESEKNKQIANNVAMYKTYKDGYNKIKNLSSRSKSVCYNEEFSINTNVTNYDTTYTNRNNISNYKNNNYELNQFKRSPRNTTNTKVLILMQLLRKYSKKFMKLLPLCENPITSIDAFNELKDTLIQYDNTINNEKVYTIFQQCNNDNDIIDLSEFEPNSMDFYSKYENKINELKLENEKLIKKLKEQECLNEKMIASLKKTISNEKTKMKEIDTKTQNQIKYYTNEIIYKDKIIAYLEMLLQNTNNDNNNNVTDDGNECEEGENENENINVSNNYKCSNNNDIVNNCNQSKYIINENICKSKNNYYGGYVDINNKYMVNNYNNINENEVSEFDKEISTLKYKIKSMISNEYK